MSDDEQVTHEVAPEVVDTETEEQVEAPEAAENTEGQPDEPPAEGKPDAESGGEPEDHGQRTTRAQRRKAQLDRLREEARQAREAKERAEAELAELKQYGSEAPPKQEDFKDYDEYVAEYAAWASERRLNRRESKRLEKEAKKRQEQIEAYQQQQAAEAEQNWSAQLDAARKRYADFDAVATAPNVPITPDMASVIKQSDHAADLAYHLGSNPDVAAKLAGMHPVQMVGAMAILEDIVSSRVPRPKTTTTVPDPVTPVKAKGGATVDPAKMTPNQYREWRASGGTF